jgi:glucoamylase
VISDGTYAYLRATLENLDPTFGMTDGAQLLDVYVQVPGAFTTSTAAAYASRNYTIAPSGAWSERLEVQGFASPVWVDASGTSLGSALVLANQNDRTITAGCPRPSSERRAADGGSPSC